VTRFALPALVLGVLSIMAACGSDEQEASPTIRPDPNKTFGDPSATVTITEYFDYR
jgi:hypothetical protein